MIIVAARQLVFNPYSQMGASIDAAASAIGDYFDGIDSAMEAGDEIGQAVKGKRIHAVMHRVISSARTQGFLTAAKHSKKPMPALYGRKVLKVADKRASKVNDLMKATTKRVLKNSPDSEYVLSRERAIAAARYEAARSFFRGVKDGFQGTRWKKSWITSAAEPCDECQDNEEAGPIDVDDVFPSGDEYPSAHLNCACMVAMHP